MLKWWAAAGSLQVNLLLTYSLWRTIEQKQTNMYKNKKQYSIVAKLLST